LPEPVFPELPEPELPELPEPVLPVLPEPVLPELPEPVFPELPAAEPELPAAELALAELAESAFDPEDDAADPLELDVVDPLWVPAPAAARTGSVTSMYEAPAEPLSASTALAASHFARALELLPK
jgi:hypothetical protein